MKTIAFNIFLISLFYGNAFGQVAVIAHPSVPIEKISKSDLFDIYIGETRFWDNDKTITVFDLRQNSDTTKSFYNYLGKSPSRMKSIWMVNLLSGEGDPPESVETEENMLESIANTPGAIGFISQGKVDNLVKVLQVIE